MLNLNDEPNKPSINADHNSIAVGSISAGGNIGNVDIHTGYTAEEVAAQIVQIASTFQPKPFDGRCPYKGLDVFEEEDAGLFFGREKLVDDLVNRVKESRTVFVTGPSGSGKSSLVRAGLIHALKQGTIKGSERWLYATLKPGRDPIGELGRVVSSLASSTNPEDEIRAKAMKDATIFARWCEVVLKEGRDKRLILFIDQFEEVFTQISKEEERVAFLNLLTHAATIENGRVIVLFSMRSDFVSNCATYPQLNALLNQQFVQIGAMQPEELVSAIAQPALRVGLRIDPDLIAQIINEMKGEPGALPLMQFALKDLFDSQQEKSGVPALTLNNYLQRGGIHKALERHADDSFANLNADEQELVRSIFSILVKPGKDTPDTRCTVLFKDLVPAKTKAEEVKAIVQKLADARLLTTDEKEGKDTVTISHEKLIEAWPWLRKLVNDNREVMALQGEIAADATEWNVHEQDASYLYSGARLASVREQLDAGKLDLRGTAYEFIEKGKGRQKRIRTITISGISTIIALLLLAVIVFSRQSSFNAQTASTAQAASTYAVSQQETAQANAEEAQKQAKMSRAGELAAQSIEMRERNFRVSLLLGIEAFRLFDSVQTRGALMDAANANPNINQILSGHTNSVNILAFSPDGKTLASAGNDNTIILWDMETNQILGQIFTNNTKGIFSLAFSPDGKTLASGGAGGYEGGLADHTISLWDVESLSNINYLVGHIGGKINIITFSPDGNMIASGSDDHSIILWDAVEDIGHLTGHTSSVVSLAFTPDGKTLESGSIDGSVILWDIQTQQPREQLVTESTSVSNMAFSPDGNVLASGSNDGSIILWNIQTDQPIGTPLTIHKNTIVSLAFSPNGKTLASGSLDNTIILWDVKTQQPIGESLTGHTSFVLSVAFSPNGKTLASGSSDSSVILWNLDTQPLIGPPLTEKNTFLAFTPDVKTLAIVSGIDNNEISLWDLATNQQIGKPLTETTSKAHISTMAFSPDGKTLVSVNNSLSDGKVTIWDTKTQQPINHLQVGFAYVNKLSFSPDGKILASGFSDNKIILWDMETYQAVGSPLTGHTNFISSLAFSPNGKTLASGSADGAIILWDIETHRPIRQSLTEHIGEVLSIGFSPDGKTLVSTGVDNKIILWDTTTHYPISIIANSKIEYDTAFNPKGNILASGGFDKTITLWDTETFKTIGLPLARHTQYIYGLAFSSDGKTLASVSLKGEIILWDLDPQEWIKQSCQRSGSSFTYAEWERYFPNEEYRATCPQWPLDFESIKTIAQNALSNADDPNQVKTALDKVQAELAKNDAIQYLFTESHNIVSVAIVENILEFVATGDTKTALDLFGQAKQMQVQISVDDKIEFYKTIAEVVLSNSDDPNRLSTAFDGVNMALEIDGTVKDPGTEALNIINDTTLKQISVEAVPHDIKKALDLFEQANQMQINITITDTNVLNDLCWFGSLQGYAKQALQHCEAAVKLAPDVGYIRDSRGLAYALAGDYQGAILDFQYYVDSNSADSDTVQQRKQWIEQLKKGINPFTSDVLESLNSQ